MSVDLAEPPGAPKVIPADEWSILELLLSDRWPDGRPRLWYPPVLDVFSIAAKISVLATSAAYVVSWDVFEPVRMIIGVGLLVAFMLWLLAPPLINLFKDHRTTPGHAAEKLPPPFAARNERFARLCAAGRAEAADRQAAKACRRARKALGADHPVLAEMLYGRAMLRVTMDKPETTVALLEGAERIWRGTLAPGSLDLADVDYALAMVYRAMGDARRAEWHYRACAELTGGFGEPGSRLLVSSLLAVGEIREELGDTEGAESLYRRVIELLGDRPGRGRKRCLIAIDRLIAIQLARHDYPAARALVLRALQVTYADYPDGHPFLADRLDDLGRLYHSMGAYARADPLYERAEEIRRRAFGEDTPLYTLSLCNLAELAAATGDPAWALDLLEWMSDVESQFMGRAAAGRSERQLIAYTSMFYANMCKFLSIVVENCRSEPEIVAAAFGLVERRKAAGIEALAVRREVMAKVRGPLVEKSLERLGQLRRQIARMSRVGPSAGMAAAAYRHRLAGLQAERDDLEVDLSRRAQVPDRDSQLGREEQIVSRSDMPDGAVLVEFVKFHVFRFNAVPARGEPRWGPPRYLAFVFPSAITQDVALHDLGEAGPIDRWITEFRAEVATDPGGPRQRDMAIRVEPVSGPAGGQEAGRALYDALFRPLRGSIGDRRRLLLAPDGDLNRLPFEVLPIGPGRRLIEDYELSYVTVGRDLRCFAERARGTAGPPLVLANPDFDSLEDPAGTNPTRSARLRAVPGASRRSANLEWDDQLFDHLPGSRAEGQDVAALLGVEPVMGTGASGSRLRSCRSPRVLHLATHGFFLSDQDLEDDRLKSMLDAQPWMEDAILEARLTARERTIQDIVNLFGGWVFVLQPDLIAELNDLDREMARVRRLASEAGRLAEFELENPLLRSGLVLAGANVGLRSEGALLADDGLLTAEDVTGLDLAGTELVVLSACETGLGDVRTGEGVFGLRRAFALAGARTLIISLWKVPDEATRELMVNFYRFLLAGQGRAEALRKAQLAMKARYPKPFYWAPFICQGDPGPLSTPIHSP